MKTHVLLLAVTPFVCPLSSAHAQLGGTNFDGIRINAYFVGFRGDTRDLDCHVILELNGQKFDQGLSLSQTRVLSAVDDTGLDLVRHTRRLPRLGLCATRTSDGFIQTLELKSPSAGAKAIRNLEWEADLVTGKANVTTQTLRLKLNSVRLPRFDPPALEVTARSLTWPDDLKPKQPAAWILLNFAGGPVPQSAGIRSLSIHHAETSSGQKLSLSESSQIGMQQFSQRESYDATGNIIRKGIGFDMPDRNARLIRRIEGEAEMFFPTRANGGLVEFGGFAEHPGVPLRDPVLAQNKIKLTFLGRENFETKRKESHPTRIRFVSSVPPGMPEEVKDSLLFAVDDPEKRLVNVVFSDEQGATLPVQAQVIQTEFYLPHSNRFNLYTFKTPPPAGTRLTVQVTTPESLRRVPFKVENIPLP